MSLHCSSQASLPEALLARIPKPHTDHTDHTDHADKNNNSDRIVEKSQSYSKQRFVRLENIGRVRCVGLLPPAVSDQEIVAFEARACKSLAGFTKECSIARGYPLADNGVSTLFTVDVDPG